MGADWEMLPLSEAPLEIIDGDRGVNYPKQADFAASGDCLFLNTGNVTTTGFNFSDCNFISRDKDAALRKGKLRRRDVVLTTRGTVGNVAYFDSSVPYENVRINSGMVLLRADQSRLWPQFLYHFVRSPNFIGQVAALSTGSAQPQLPIRDIRRVKIPLPPLIEQKAIAAVLSSLDDKIELNRRMNATLEAISQSLFKSWFVGATRDKLPGGWREGTLGEVAENPRPGVQPNKINSHTPYIGLEHMPRRCIALSDWGYAGELESNKFEFKRGDILFGKLRPYFHKVGVAPLDGICSTDILIVRPKQLEWFGFVLGHVSSVKLVNHTDANSTGTKMPRTSWSDIACYEVAIPPENLAAKLSESIRPLIDRIIANIHESCSLAALRDALLPKLLSGELRLQRNDVTP